MIECSTFILRPVKKEDVNDLFEYGSDLEVTKYMPWGPFKTLNEVEGVIEEVFLKRPDRGEPVAFAIEDKATKKMIGTCDFHSLNARNRVGEIGFCLNRTYWNKGIVTEAVKAVISFGFEELKLERVQLCHATDNLASKRVAEKSILNFEGCLRGYLNIKGIQKDALMYGLTLKEYQSL